MPDPPTWAPGSFPGDRSDQPRSGKDPGGSGALTRVGASCVALSGTVLLISYWNAFGSDGIALGLWAVTGAGLLLIAGGLVLPRGSLSRNPPASGTALQEISEGRFRSLTDTSQATFLLLDEAGHLRHANPAGIGAVRPP